jgi:hypothetical protein
LVNTAAKRQAHALSSAEASVGYDYDYNIEINFTTLYMADLGTRAEPLGEGEAPLVFHLNII